MKEKVQMAYEPVSNTVPQYAASGSALAGAYYLKGYQSGTTTPLAMGIDRTPTSTLAKCALNSLGYPISNSSDETTVFIPHFNAEYKLVLYPSSTAADANDFASAIWVLDELGSSQVFPSTTATVASMVALDLAIGAVVTTTGYYAANDGGHGSYVVVAGGTGTDDGGEYHDLDNGNQVRLILGDEINAKVYGCRGNGTDDDTAALGLWLDKVISSDLTGLLPDGDYPCNSISKSLSNGGIKLRGSGRIIANGSSRVNMFNLTAASGFVDIDGITIDGNNIVARPFEIQNTGATTTTLGDVYIGPGCKIWNARNNAPDTFTATGLRVLGGMNTVVISGEIKSVDSTSTSGAVSIGVWIAWTGSGEDWVRSTTLTSSCRIINVRNSNTSVADADGIQATAPTDKHATLTVAPGCLFEDCEGRAIKSQVIGNTIIGAEVRRLSYDGVIDINLQYAGGVVQGNRILHDGTFVTSVIGVSQRPTPDNTQCTVSGNELTVTGTPSSNTNAMVATDVTDAAVKVQGITIKDNKVKGTVEYMTSHRVANTVDVNRVVVSGNWAETINTAFLQTTLFGSARAQLSVVFTDNGAENTCTGASITDDLIVEYARNNHNIGRLITNPFTVTIATGAVTVYGRTHRVTTEGGAGTDDLDTINTVVDWNDDDTLTLFANNDARTVVLKDGTGNLRLAGDFSLTHSNDRIVLAFDGTNWCEISRSDNTA